MPNLSKLHIYRTWDEVNDSSFINQWKQWIKDAPDGHVFYHPAMVKLWVDTYRRFQDITPIYCVAEIDDVTVFLPLVLWKRNWKNARMKVVIPVGYTDFDYHDPIMTAPVTRKLTESFWDLINIEVFSKSLVKYDKVDLPGFRFPGNEETWDEEEDICPYADLSRFKDYPAYQSSLKSNLRQDIERRKRRLSDLGEWNYKVFDSTGAAEALKLLPDFLAAHSLRWPNHYKAPGFHEALLNDGIPAGLVHFSTLTLNSKPISWHLGFLFKKRFYYYMPTFLEQYADRSPGKVHMASMIEDCFTRDVQLFDYLRGDENYKMGWAKNLNRLFRYAEHSSSIGTVCKLGACNFVRKLVGKDLISITTIVMNTLYLNYLQLDLLTDLVP